jgi:hypothetical protein
MTRRQSQHRDLLAYATRSALVVLLSVLALLGLMRAIGAVGTAPNIQAASLQICAGLPCLLGITPGTTPWDSAAQMIHYPAEVETRRAMFRPPEALAGRIETYLSVDEHTVGRVYLFAHERAPLPVGWIIVRYGAPCGVSLYYGADMLTLRYQNLQAHVELTDGRFTPSSPVSIVRYHDPAFVFESQPDPCVDNITSQQVVNTQWQSFARLERLMHWLAQP